MFGPRGKKHFEAAEKDLSGDFAGGLFQTSPLRTRWPVGGEIMLGCLVFHTHWNQQEWQKHEPTRDLPCEGGSCELQGATP
ncbi:hypothetical protein GN956_G1415 [Arapaima gigas]